MPGMYKSFKSGKLMSVPKVPTLADGIAIEHVGAIPFEQIKHHVDDMVLVDEDEIAAGVLTLLEKEKTVCEVQTPHVARRSSCFVHDADGYGMV